MISQAWSAVSTKWKRSRSSGEIVPASASASQLTMLRQNSSPKRTTGTRSTRSVWIKKWRIDEEFIVWDEPKAFGFVVLTADGPIGRFAQTLLERVDIQVLSTDRVRVSYMQGFEARSAFSARMLGFASNGLKKTLRAALGELEKHIERERAAS